MWYYIYTSGVAGQNFNDVNTEAFLPCLFWDFVADVQNRILYISFFLLQTLRGLPWSPTSLKLLWSHLWYWELQYHENPEPWHIWHCRINSAAWAARVMQRPPKVGENSKWRQVIEMLDKYPLRGLCGWCFQPPTQKYAHQPGNTLPKNREEIYKIN